ncbi:MAG: hypothetical protein LBG06_00645 [Deltaproteobacteria bacterium]|nr:hypothetical protein [Deltaproteobacteria bacterium]
MRLYFWTIAELLGHGGIAFVSRLSGMSAATVSRSVRESGSGILPFRLIA